MKSIKLHIFLITCIIGLPNAYSTCMTSDFTLDINCNCANSDNCFQYKASTLKGRARKNNKASKTDKAGLLLKKNLFVYKKVNNFMKGDISYDAEFIKKSREQNKKMEAVRKKLRPYVEKFYKKAGAQITDLDKRREQTRKYLNKGISPKVKDYLENTTTFKMATPNNKNYIGTNSKKKNINEGAKESLEVVSKSNESVSQNAISESDILKARGEARKIVRNKRYKYKDLLNKNIDLFNVISQRYKRQKLKYTKREVTSVKLFMEKVKNLK